MNVNKDELVAKLKELVKKGNVSRISVIDKAGNTVFSTSMNVGLVGGVIGLAVAPWALIIGAVAAVGTKCRIEVTKTDGTKLELLTEGDKDDQ